MLRIILFCVNVRLTLPTCDAFIGSALEYAPFALVLTKSDKVAGSIPFCAV
jgi:hypothetical protein